MSQMLAKNIKFLMQKHDIKNPNDLAKRTKIPQPTLFRWMVEAAREPRQSSLKPLAEFFGVEVNDLMGRDIETGEVHTEVSQHRLRKDVFIVDFADLCKYTGGVKPSDYKHLTNDMPVIMARVPSNAYGVVVKGDAMSPVIPDGARLVIDPNRAAKHGDYVIAVQPVTHVPVLRRMVEEGGYVYLYPENPMFEATKIVGEPQILGVVAEMQIVKIF